MISALRDGEQRRVTENVGAKQRDANGECGVACRMADAPALWTCFRRGAIVNNCLSCRKSTKAVHEVSMRAVHTQ